MITPEQASKILLDTIRYELRHTYYDKAIEVKKYCHKIMTGEGQRADVIRYRDKATDEQKEELLKINNSLTPYVINPIYTTFNRVHRSDGIKAESGIKHRDAESQERIQKVLERFYQKNNLSTYLNKKLLQYIFYDPNAFLIVERQDERDSEAIIELRTYPLEVSSEQAINYSYDKSGELEWLIVEQQRVNYDIETETEKEPLSDFYLYAAGFTFFYSEVETKEEAANLLIIETKKSGERFFDVKGNQLFNGLPYFVTGSEEIPAKKTGYIDHPEYKHIKLPPYYAAKTVLDDLIRDKMLLDVNKIKHTFLKLMMYSERCVYEDGDGNKCWSGYLNADTSHKCPNCHGTGYNFHASEQDVIFLTLPDLTSGGSMPSLADMAHYIDIPIDIVNVLIDEVDKSTQRAHFAVFNTQAIDLEQLAQPETATFHRIDYDKLFNTLKIYADHYSEMWELFARVSAQYLEIQDVEIDHAFPEELDIKTLAEQVAEYEQAKKAGMSYEVISELERKVIKKLYRNIPEKQVMVDVKRKLIPFASLPENVLMVVLSSRTATDPARIAYENQDEIFTEIEEENPDFYSLSYTRQKEIFDRKVAEIAEQLELPEVESPFQSIENGEMARLQ